MGEEKDFSLRYFSSCHLLTMIYGNKLAATFCEAFQIILQKKYIRLGIEQQDVDQVLEVFHYIFR